MELKEAIFQVCSVDDIGWRCLQQQGNKMRCVDISPVFLNGTKHELSLNWKIKLLLPHSCRQYY